VTPSLRFHITAATVALVALACVAAGLILLPDLQPARITPADFLPADATVVYAEFDDPSSIKEASAFIPALRVLPATTDAIAAAIIRRNTTTDWLMFRHAPEGSTDPFVVSASRPEALNFLHAENALSADRVFSSLWPEAGRLRAVAHITDLPGPDGLLAGSIRPAWPFALALTDTSAELSLPPADVSGTSPMIGRMPGIAFAVAGADLRALLSAALRESREPLPLLAQALISGAVRDAAGPDISVTADLLPLAHGPAALYIATGSGKLSMAFDGLAENDDDADRVIARIAGALAAVSPAVRREQRSFERDFRIDALRGTTGSLVFTEQIRDGWTVRTATRTADGHSIILAQSGRRVLLGNDPALVRRIIEQDGPAASPSVLSREIGGGILERAALQRLLRALFPEATGLELVPLSGLPWPDPLVWSARIERSRTVLTVRSALSAPAASGAPE
jgi:hypothetical protein